MCGHDLLYAPVETLERTFALDLVSQRPNLEPSPSDLIGVGGPIGW